jgi:pimeloyl-ACP methyl ester carboxylesterase/predicted glycoside hydrolase/deacetylase ChbG (UPF0249 family)
VTRTSRSLVFVRVFILSVTTIGSIGSQAGETKGKYADVNGLKMYYEIHGTGEPLVLLHGGIATIDNSFGKLIPGLAKHHRVIALEQQGHGHTRDIDRPLSYAQMAEDTVALLAQLKIEKADFFGWSDGAAVALQIAIKHPQMVRKLAMIGISYNNDGLEPEVVKGIASLTPEMIPKQFHDDYEKAAPEPGQWAGVVGKIRTMAVEWKGFSPGDLRGVRAPVLVMVGDRDIVRAEHAVEMFRLFPNAQLAVLPGVDHFGVVQRPDWVLGMVTAFLDTPSSANSPSGRPPLQVRLGYPADAKLLILNADDLAVSHSENLASFAALDERLITSATVMVPCPWFTEVAAYARSHPRADLGLHLTLTSEWETYRWGPVAPRALVPSLVGPDGYFYADTASVAKHANLAEVEIELRSQIDRAISMGLEPTHLDAHMHVLYANRDLFGVFLKVAHAYRLPIRMAWNDRLFESVVTLMPPNEPFPDAIFSPGADVPAAHWVDYYTNLVRNLQPGVTEVFMHLAHDDAESQAVMVGHPDWGAAWRQREFDAISSPVFRKALEDNHVILIGWREMKSLL